MTTKFISAQEQKVSEPLPLEAHEEVLTEQDGRIWIGNVDPNVNEYSLLHLLRKFGRIKEIDFLYYKSGPLQGKSRGFHFASFCSKQEAQKAIDGLNGKYLLSKAIQVRWAHQQQTDEKVPMKINLRSDLVKNSFDSTKSTSKSVMINSIEKKLKEMEGTTQTSTSSGRSLHPLLKLAKQKSAAEEARKRTFPYKKPHSRQR